MISTFCFDLVNMLGFLGYIPVGWVTDVVESSTEILFYTLTPRFVISIRELYALDTQGRCDVDSGFGLSSGGGRGVGGTATIGTIAFAEAGEIRGSNDGEEAATGVECAQSGNSRLEVLAV